MPANQMELWCAEPHLTPRIYSQLSLEQRTRLILQLAGLMLQMVRNQPTPKSPPTPPQTHEQ
jgi:hypothetical protein